MHPSSTSRYQVNQFGADPGANTCDSKETAVGTNASTATHRAIRAWPSSSATYANSQASPAVSVNRCHRSAVGPWVQAGGGAGSSVNRPASHSRSPMMASPQAPCTSRPTNATSRTACAQATYRGVRRATAARSRTDSVSTEATSDHGGRPKSARYSSLSGSPVATLSRNAPTISSSHTAR